MKKTIIAISLFAAASLAHATNTPGADCVGVNACKTNSDNVTMQPHATGGNANASGGSQWQQQQQNQNASATGGNVGGVNVAPRLPFPLAATSTTIGRFPSDLCKPSPLLWQPRRLSCPEW